MIKVAVIPCFKTKEKAADVALKSLNYVDKVICVDDNCPYKTYEFISKRIKDDNLIIIKNKANLGVGGAFKVGLEKALDLGAEYIIKIDSDGQMNPELIPLFIRPLEENKALFVKGNRFRNSKVMNKMPKIRLYGNIFLSFLTKLSTGYWELFDPTNGFIAFKKELIKQIPIHKLDNRFFFETDLLFRVGLTETFIIEIPIEAIYEDEKSNLNSIREIPNFSVKHINLIFKRILYSYFLFDFNPGSFFLLISLFFGFVSVSIASCYFIYSNINKIATPTGIQTLFLALFFISLQFFINFIHYDISQKPLIRMIKKIG